jgi:LCP family protein required for cell wall assembly
MTKSQKFVFSFLLMVAIVLGIYVYKLYQTPLGPALYSADVTPIGFSATWTPDPASASNGSVKTYGACNALSPMTILVIGSDTRAEGYLYGLADVIRLVRVDFVNPKVTVLEIPRDLWVEIPDIADNLDGQTHEKLNQAYLYGNRGFGYTDDPAQGPGLLARTLTLNFGTRIDNYAAVNMYTFTKIVDAVGGIDVTLPKAVDGRTADDRSERLVFPAGTHLLNGTRALTLARIRISGTFARADNQDRVLCALRDKLTSSDVVTKVPQLIQSFQGAVQTDLSPEQLGQLACISTQIQPQNIIFASFPQEHFQHDRTYDPVFKKQVFTWNVDFAILRDYVARFNNGNWPQATFSEDTEQEESFICQ